MSAHHDHADAESARETIRWCPRCERGAGDADRCPACEGATVPRAVDPLDVIPAGFVGDWNAESDAPVTTIADALRVAEAAPSTTPASELPRCPECLSSKVRWESGTRTCDECSATFDHPLPAPSDAHERAAHAPTTDSDFQRPRCPACHSVALMPVPERAPALAARWVCLDCASACDDPAPSLVEVARQRAARRRDRDHEPIGDAHEQATLGEVTDS